ncbi:DnaJ-domain-containing protein [Piedraia hortae CBS 480.64]|uniref:DnaJ-domain-containing protein n=1 Tax=Piedraia hortae CBS 480.64 TaxID=1314780 RepID=A0A6A7C6S6_9PEZI|nr:DnaJ-domain-containing protein [Piedraia hortae CBS 480.64]
MAAEDLKSQALNPPEDFYELIGVPINASDSDIRRSWRKAALKCHPDKVGNDEVARKRFHRLQVALEILSDAHLRDLHDNARRARSEKKRREDEFDEHRKRLKEDLERRERAGLKRKREEAQAEAEFDMKLREIQNMSRRRKQEYAEKRRKEAQAQKMEANKPQTQTQIPQEADRSIAFQYPKDSLSQKEVLSLCERFGPIAEVVVRDKKVKVNGEKKRREYTSVVLEYESIVGAHAAISDIGRLQAEDAATWKLFENVRWADGKEPEYISKLKQSQIKDPPKSTNAPADLKTRTESILIRMKHAQKKRMEEKEKRNIEECKPAT